MRVWAGLGANSLSAHRILQTDADDKSFRRTVARGFGLDRLDDAEGFLEDLDQLAVAAAMEHLGHQRAVRLQMPGRKILPVLRSLVCSG